jgi:hypothetical protein
MDPFTMTLAGQAVAALTPLLKKGAEALVNELGTKLGDNVATATVDKLKGLLNRIRVKFSGDDEAVDALRNFEKKPDRYASTVQDILKERLDKDKDFAKELDGLVKGVNLNIIIKMTEGKEVTGLKSKEMKSGTANVNMDIGKGEKITGAEFESIG